MSDKHTVSERIEDHALERVPPGDRHNWLQISWNTAGIVTTLIQIYIGATITFMAGMELGLLTGLCVAIIGGALGWGLGHIAYRSGLAATVMSRLYGFGVKGSLITSAIFGFIIIGFIAVENILLYKGFIYYFGLEDTLQNQILIYGLLSLAWIALTAYGFDIVTRVASITLVGFLGVLIYMMFTIVGETGQPWREVLNFGVQFSDAELAEAGALSTYGKVVVAVNMMMGPAGALALVDADLGRYARSSKDIGIAAYIGNFFMDVAMVGLGGIIMYAVVHYSAAAQGISTEEARLLTSQSPEHVAIAFILFGGWIGTVLMVLAQSKAQVLNTYSSSLSLTNLFDAVFSWRPGRLFFVILANLLAIGFLYGEILTFFYNFLKILGILTTCFSGIIMADYFIVRPRLGHEDTDRFGADYVNWAGVTSIVIGFVLAHYVLNDLIPIEFLTSLAVSFLVYPILRIYVLKPHYHSARIE